MHRPEVVPDQGQRRALGQAIGEPVQRRAQPPLLELDVGDVGLGIDRVRHPGQAPRRQDASDAQARELARLRQELRPIASVLAEPVQEQDPGADPAVGRLDDIRLDRAVARPDDDVLRPRAAPSPPCGHCAGCDL